MFITITALIWTFMYSLSGRRISGIIHRLMDLFVHASISLRLTTAYINGSHRASPLLVSVLIQIGPYLQHMLFIVIPQLVAVQSLPSKTNGPLTSSMQNGFAASQLQHQRQIPCSFYCSLLIHIGSRKAKLCERLCESVQWVILYLIWTVSDA